MARVKIKVGDTFLDTFSNLDDIFYVTEQKYDLRQLDTRKADFTRQIEIPATRNNLTALNRLTNETLGNRGFDCVISLDDINFHFGRLFIVDDSRKVLNIIILAGNFTLFDSISDASLRTLDMSAYNFPWTEAGLAAIGPSTTSGVFIGSSRWERTDSMENGGSIPGAFSVSSGDINNYGFFFHAKTLFKEIINQAGFTLDETGLASENYYHNMVIACPVQVPPIDPVFDYAQVSRTGTNFLYNAWLQLGVPVTVQFNNTISDTGGLWDGTNFRFQTAKAGNHTIIVDLIFDYNRDSNGSMDFDIILNGTTSIYNASYVTSQTNERLYINITRNLAINDTIELEVAASYQNSNRFDVVEIYTSTSPQFQLAEQGQLPQLDLNVSDFLPDMSQTEFIRGFLSIFNAFIDSDAFSKEASLLTWEDFIKLTPNDLTNNLDLTTEPVNEISIPTYFRKSWLRYQKDNIERTDVDYAVNFSNDETLPIEGDILSLPFSASDSVEGFTQIEIGAFRMSYRSASGFTCAIGNNAYSFTNDVDIKAGQYIYDGTDFYKVQTVLTNRTGNLWVNHFSGVAAIDIQIVDWEPIDIIPRLATVDRGSVSNVIISTNGFGPSFPSTLIQGEQVIFDATWQVLHDQYYINMFDALQTPKIIVCWMAFKTLEFYNIEPLKPATIQGFNGRYYINKIEQFKLNSPCRVELIRIDKLIQ